MFYLDTSGNQIDLESTLEELKTIDTSDAKAAAQSAENAALSTGDAKTYASNASDSALAASSSVGDA